MKKKWSNRVALSEGLIAKMVREYESGMSTPMIALRHGKSQSTVRCGLIRGGARIRSRSESARLAADCGRLWPKWRSRTRKPFTKEHCRRIAMARLAAPAAGLSLKPNGYVEITRGKNKGRGLHRAIMEERLGIRLPSSMVVHHKDGNKTNNALSNLEVMSRSAHTSLHRRMNCNVLV